MDAGVLKEFLIKLGFSVDQSGLRKLQTGLKDVTGAVTGITKAALGMAAAVTAAVTVTARSLDELYYASQRADSTADTLMTIGHAARSVGLSASGVRSQIEGMAASFRDMPAMRSWLQNLTGASGDPGQMMEGFAKYYRQMMLSGREMMARMVLRAGGMDPEQIRQMAMNLPAFLKSKAEMEKWFSALGFNANQASEAAANFLREINRSWGLFTTVWGKLTVTLLPILEDGLRNLNNLVISHMGDIKAFIDGPLKDWVTYLTDRKTWDDWGASWQKIGGYIDEVRDSIKDVIAELKELAAHRQAIGLGILALGVGMKSPALIAVGAGLVGSGPLPGDENYGKDKDGKPSGDTASHITPGMVGAGTGAALGARFGWIGALIGSLIGGAAGQYAAEQAPGQKGYDQKNWNPAWGPYDENQRLWPQFERWLSGQTHSPNVDIYEANGLWSTFKTWLAGSTALAPVVALADATFAKLRDALGIVPAKTPPPPGTTPANVGAGGTDDRSGGPQASRGARTGETGSPLGYVARSDTSAALALIEKYESAGRNVMNFIGDARHTAQGYWQITNTNWKKIAPTLGIDTNQYPNAMSAPRDVQAKVAQYMYNKGGFSDWAPYNPRLAAAIRAGELNTILSKTGPSLDAEYERHKRLGPKALDAWLNHVLSTTNTTGFDKGNATDAATKVSNDNSTTTNHGDQQVSIAPTTTIHVHGSDDPRQTANYVAGAQSRVTAQAVRAFQPASA